VIPCRLQDDIREDPWVSFRTKKYMSNPKRHGFKNRRILQKRYRLEYWTNFLIGAALSFPAAIWMGQRMQRYQGGVAVVPIQRFVHDHPDISPMRTTLRYFKRWHFGTMFVAGSIFA
jgi:hypothetical protein